MYTQIGELSATAVQLNKLCILDLDGTLVEPQPQPVNVVWLPGALEAVATLARHYCIVVITNQAGWRRWPQQVRSRIVQVQQQLVKATDQTCPVWIARSPTGLGRDAFRKPSTGLVEQFLNYAWLEVLLVGDAAGRRDDHSDSDYALALNTNKLLQLLGRNSQVRFMTDTVFLGGKSSPPRLRSPDWSTAPSWSEVVHDLKSRINSIHTSRTASVYLDLPDLLANSETADVVLDPSDELRADHEITDIPAADVVVVWRLERSLVQHISDYRARMGLEPVHRMPRRPRHRGAVITITEWAPRLQTPRQVCMWLQSS